MQLPMERIQSPAIPSNSAVSDMQPSDFAEVLSLNNLNIAAVGELTKPKLKFLFNNCETALVAHDDDQLIAFAFAFREGSTYNSPNYAYFVERHAQFLYVDRIVVAKECQGQGVGSKIYKRLLKGPLVCLEVNAANPRSREFHINKGFAIVERVKREGYSVDFMVRGGKAIANPKPAQESRAPKYEKQEQK